MVTFNVYEGTTPQTPIRGQVELGETATYQDLISYLIQTTEKRSENPLAIIPGRSGMLTSLDGQKLDYNLPITLPEVNYVLLSKHNAVATPDQPYHGQLWVRYLDGTPVPIPYYRDGTLQDIYNHVQHQGAWNKRIKPGSWGRNVFLVLEESKHPELADSELVERKSELTSLELNSEVGTGIRFPIAPKSTKVFKLDKLLNGRIIPKSTPLKRINLEPSSTFHLVKSHHAMQC